MIGPSQRDQLKLYACSLSLRPAFNLTSCDVAVGPSVTAFWSSAFLVPLFASSKPVSCHLHRGFQPVGILGRCFPHTLRVSLCAALGTRRLWTADELRKAHPQLECSCLRPDVKQHKKRLYIRGVHSRSKQVRFRAQDGRHLSCATAFRLVG